MVPKCIHNTKMRFIILFRIMIFLAFYYHVSLSRLKPRLTTGDHDWPKSTKRDQVMADPYSRSIMWFYRGSHLEEFNFMWWSVMILHLTVELSFKSFWDRRAWDLKRTEIDLWDFKFRVAQSAKKAV